MGSRMTVSGGGMWGGEGIEQKGLMDMVNSVVIARGRRGIRGINGNGKNTIKFN